MTSLTLKKTSLTLKKTSLTPKMTSLTLVLTSLISLASCSSVLSTTLSSPEQIADIYFNTKSIVIGKNSPPRFVDLVLTKTLTEDAEVDFRFYDEGAVKNSSGGVLENVQRVVFRANETKPQVKLVSLMARGVGQATLILSSSSPELVVIPSFNHTFVVVDIVHSIPLTTFNMILGWLYMVCWGISYYPQFYLNFQSWSVAGFNVDYALLNVLAYCAYAIVMCSMYWDERIKAIYFKEHPHSNIPVEISDLASVIHNLIIISCLALQCVFLPRGGQKLSIVSWVCLGAFISAPLISLPFAATDTMNWLDFVHVFSYIKIGISLVKYAPQAFMNWRRKSTAGYSPINICLDFSGSTFLVLQLVLLAINRNDIWSMIGNPAKFGVGFASWIFTGIFMVQKFILYRSTSGEYQILINDNSCKQKQGYDSCSDNGYGSVQ